jgi:hypothetical protein
MRLAGFIGGEGLMVATSKAGVAWDWAKTAPPDRRTAAAAAKARENMVTSRIARARPPEVDAGSAERQPFLVFEDCRLSPLLYGNRLQLGVAEV